MWPQVFFGMPSPAVSPAIPARSLTHSFLTRCIKVMLEQRESVAGAWHMYVLLLLQFLKQQLLSVRCAAHSYDRGFARQHVSLVSTHCPKTVWVVVCKTRLLFPLLKQFLPKQEMEKWWNTMSGKIKKGNYFEIKTYFYLLAFFFSPLLDPLSPQQIKAYEFKASHLRFFSLLETNISI